MTLATTFIWQISLLYFLLIPTLIFQLVDSWSNSWNSSPLQNSLLNHIMILIGLELRLHQHVIVVAVRALHWKRGRQSSEWTRASWLLLAIDHSLVSHRTTTYYYLIYYYRLWLCAVHWTNFNAKGSSHSSYSNWRKTIPVYSVDLLVPLSLWPWSSIDRSS